MSCILRVTTRREHFQRVTKQLWARPIRLWHDDPALGGNSLRKPGFELLIASDQDHTFDVQTQKALACLREHYDVVFSWYQDNLVESVVLNCGVRLTPNMMAHYAQIPIGLIHLCSDARVAIEVSHYVAA